jgi:hypothetical protein
MFFGGGTMAGDRFDSADGDPRVGRPYEVLVERGKIREFAGATGARSVTYFADEAPIAPPTFLMVSALWATPDSHPAAVAELDNARVLHAGQEFVFHGPRPRAGDRLMAQVEVEEVYTKQGRRGGELLFMVLLTTFRDADRIVAEARQTLVQTAHAAGRDHA